MIMGSARAESETHHKSARLLFIGRKGVFGTIERSSTTELEGCRREDGDRLIWEDPKETWIHLVMFQSTNPCMTKANSEINRPPYTTMMEVQIGGTVPEPSTNHSPLPYHRCSS